MPWLFTLYDNYGSLLEIFRRLHSRWENVKVVREEYNSAGQACPHYHCMVKNIKNGLHDTYEANKKFLHIMKKWKAKHKIWLGVCNEDNAIFRYLDKQGFQSLSNYDIIALDFSESKPEDYSFSDSDSETLTKKSVPIIVNANEVALPEAKREGQQSLH